MQYYEEMLKDGIRPNGRTLGKLMEAAAKQCNRREAQRWFSALSNAQQDVEELHVHMLVDAAAREGDFYAAEAWFARFSADHVLAPSIWNALLCAAARAGDVTLTESLLLKFAKSGMQPDQLTFAVVALATLEASGSSDRGIDCIEKWFSKADDFLCPEDKVTSMARVAEGAAKMGCLDVAQDLLQRMDTGLATLDGSEGTVHPALNSACFEVARALAVQGPGLLEVWIERGQKKGQDGEKGSEAWLRRSCLELVKVFASRNQLSKAEQTFLLLQQAGGADLQAFCIMVNAAAKCGDLVAAERWFERALDAGLSPDIVLFTSVVDAASRKGDMKAADYWRKRAGAFGLKASKEMLGALVHGEARKGNLQGAQRWAEVARQEYGPNLVILNCLIDAHAKDEDMRSAKRVLDRDIIGSGLQPDERSFGPLINGYAEQGLFSDALRCFRAMSSHQVRPSVVQFNQLLKACARSRPRLFQEALQIFDELMKAWAMQKQRNSTVTTRQIKLQELHDLAPTRITLKTLGRCVGARRLSQICKAGTSQNQHLDSVLVLRVKNDSIRVLKFRHRALVPEEYGIDQEKLLGTRFNAEEQKRASSTAERRMFEEGESRKDGTQVWHSVAPHDHSDPTHLLEF